MKRPLDDSDYVLMTDWTRLLIARQLLSAAWPDNGLALFVFADNAGMAREHAMRALEHLDALCDMCSKEYSKRLAERDDDPS